MIILIGFPKSGTTSFQTMFEKLGYNSIHWKCSEGYIGRIIKRNKENGRPLLTGLSDKYNCITEMNVCISKKYCYWPQIVDYKQLYQENPDALFILNKRDPMKIHSSFQRWGNYDKRLYKYNSEGLDECSESGFIRLIPKHYSDVEEFFGSLEEGKCKFVSYDIEKDSIEKLKPYMDLGDFTVLPHENVNKNRVVYHNNMNPNNIRRPLPARMQLNFL